MHGTRTTNQNELWSYGPEAQKILTDYDRLRYRLLPYIYSLAWKTTSENYTPMRPLAMDFRTDVRAQNIGDQFMFGPAIFGKSRHRAGRHEAPLIFAQGKWHDFWTGRHDWTAAMLLMRRANLEQHAHLCSRRIDYSHGATNIIRD